MVHKENNIEIKDLFHYGCDHIMAAVSLFRKPIHRFLKKSHQGTRNNFCIALDSAAYLANIGLEQILKACLLWEKGSYSKKHGINKIAKEVNFLKNRFSSENWGLLKGIDLLGQTRYPKENHGKSIEISQDHENKVIHLLDLIINAMPNELFEIYQNTGIDENCLLKGERILMKQGGIISTKNYL